MFDKNNIKLYNSLSNKIEVFKPIKENELYNLMLFLSTI